MPTTEQHPTTQDPEALDGMQELQEQRFRTIAVRVEEELHTQLSFIAQLRDSSLTEEVRDAIQKRVANAQDDPELIAKAEAARDQIRREAEARASAIAGFMGSTAARNTTSRRSTKTANK